MSKRIESMKKKLAVLEVIKCKKEILFSKFSNSITAKEKQSAWEEVLAKAKSLGLVGESKDWVYARDNLYGLWKCRALRKRDNKAQTGSGGGKGVQPDESDEMIYYIVGKESPSMGGLMLPETLIEIDKVSAGPSSTLQLHNICTPPQIPPKGDQLHLKPNPSTSTKYPARKKMKTLELHPDKREELLDVEIYYMKLKCLKLETELNLPPSKFTMTILPPACVIEVDDSNNKESDIDE